MRKLNMKFIAPLAITAILSSCGGATSNNTASSDNSGLGEALLGAIAQNVIDNNQQTGNVVNAAINAGSTISGLIGQLTGSAISASITGTWVYSEPTVQFESENLLAKAGGVVASRSIINKIAPYYQKVGITKGALTLTFNKDNTCSYMINGKKHEGTYVYDNKSHKLTITNSLGINILNAYATVSIRDMAITLDTSKLLTFLQKTSLATANNTISTISNISKSYSGMKTGFLFSKK